VLTLDLSWFVYDWIGTGAEALGITRFFCKINEANGPSIAMFEGCVLPWIEAPSDRRCDLPLFIYTHTYAHTRPLDKNKNRLGYVRINYVAAFKEIEFEFRVPSPSQDYEGLWADKWRRVVLGGGGGSAVAALMMRREPYREGEEDEKEEGH
jgi:hypothetical protein